MALSVAARLKAVETLADELQAGLFRVPIGPGTIRNKSIRPKSITSGLIDVDTLESVQSSTGSLSVSGSLTMTTAGVFSAGQTAYDTGLGWWFEFNGGTPRLSIGNSGGNKIVWNGSALSITGAVTATSGTIGGWTIGATDLTAGSGSTYTGMSVAGGSVPAFWAGNATPSSAPFKVTQAGVLTATNVVITGGALAGWTIDSTNGLTLGSTSSTRGISTGATAFYAGNATPSSAPFRVSSTGALTATSATITGAITATSGSFTGDVTTGNIIATGGTVGGWAIGSTTLVGGSVTLDSTNGIIRAGASSYSTGTGWILDRNGGTPRFRVGTATSGTNYLAFDGSAIQMRGEFRWGSSGANYLNDTTMHLECDTSYDTFSTIEWKNGANNESGHIRATSTTTVGVLQVGVITARGSSDYYAQSEYQNGTGGGLATMEAGYITGAYSTAFRARTNSTVANSSADAMLADDAGSSRLRVLNFSGTEVAGIASTGNRRLLASAGGGVVDTNAVSVATVTAVEAVYNTSGTLLGYMPIYATYA